MKKILLTTLAIGIATGLTIGGATGMTPAEGPTRVVYHVTEADKVPFVLENIKNHIKGVGGPEKVEIILVAHGPGLKPFHQRKTRKNISSLVSELQLEGVEFDACGNTMNALNFETTDLLPDLIRRDEGGVVRIAELQSQGYVYLRP